MLLVVFLLAKLCFTPNPLKGAVVGVFMGVKVPFRGFRGSRNCRFYPYLKLLNFKLLHYFAFIRFALRNTGAKKIAKRLKLNHFAVRVVRPYGVEP